MVKLADMSANRDNRVSSTPKLLCAHIMYLNYVVLNPQTISSKFEFTELTIYKNN